VTFGLSPSTPENKNSQFQKRYAFIWNTKTKKVQQIKNHNSIQLFSLRNLHKKALRSSSASQQASSQQARAPGVASETNILA
jgi:hypothetical protein